MRMTMKTKMRKKKALKEKPAAMMMKMKTSTLQRLLAKERKEVIILKSVNNSNFRSMMIN